jgi:hypothetical protein
LSHSHNYQFSLLNIQNSMSRKDFSQQFPSPHKDFSQQFPSPPNEPVVIVNTPSPAENENQQQNTPVENEPVNNPPVEQRALTDEELFEQDRQVVREAIEAEEREAAARVARENARRERLNREAPHRWALGLGHQPSESSSSEEDGWVSDDSFY